MFNTGKSYTLLFAFLIFSCAHDDVNDERSPFYAVPAGSVLTLNQTLMIRGEQVAVYVQHGELVSQREVNYYLPNCKFEIYTMSEKLRSVQADSFEIIRVVDEIESSSMPVKLQVASLLSNANDTAVVFGMLDHSQVFNYATNLYLQSDQQKDVYRMTCQHWEDIVDDRYLSIMQMRTAMGDVFTLDLK